VAGTRRTYTFDRVFGPGATQEAIYKDVAAPMLEELLNGYNCTIFAYGQTGTGKTYTMQGELDDLDSRNAGIIPRILHNLFKRLADMPGSIVNLSYAELYNEKLRDLLSPSDDGTRLRIYEDPSTRETTIDGLKIVSIESTQEGLELLRQGSEKRQVAATKCNMNSSRSHAILTLKVVVPSKGQTGGEKLFKVGKLHLVDLAGSESIGRSGAENKHAREAGMINQSLLTLGRVIKARAERAPHIPYR
jgi:kinesin family protein 11